jgi:anaphase-promoting complex subunit 3
MEIYSSLLWHVRKDVDLSFLAHELLDLDKMSPEPWCAMGNCFSLQQEPESAIKCFQRAIDLDSTYYYAHTLCGYEYTVLEDHEKAQTCFRNALRIEPRDYKAW